MGEADTVAAILGRFAPEARNEPSVQLFLVHRAAANPAQFLFYQLFGDKAPRGPPRFRVYGNVAPSRAPSPR